MKLKELKMRLSRVKGFQTTNMSLEQYMTPSDVASSIVYTIHATYNDIQGKRILDLCCGTGMLSLACGFFSPSYILGVDVCKKALEVFKSNNVGFGVTTDFIRCSVEQLTFLNCRFDTCLLNPPFGTKVKHADTRAIEKALEFCDVAYSLHKSSTREYLMRKYPRMEVLAKIKFTIPREHSFHKKNQKIIDVDFIRICGKQ